MHLVMIFLGGGLGSVLRYLVQFICAKKFGTLYPFGTFLVNIIGCFILGFLTTLILNKSHFFDANTSTKMFLTVGFTGGFTTFSTFGLESVNMLEKGLLVPAFIYVTSSIILGILAAYLGMQLAVPNFK